MKIVTSIPATDRRLSILGSVIGQLSDGIWEDSRYMEKYWKSLSYGKDANGYIYIEDKYGICSNPMDFFANKIKQIIKTEIEDGYTAKLWWDRSCPTTPCYMYGNVTVGECYELYEMLKGRDTTKYQYAIHRPYQVSHSDGKNTYAFDVEALNQTEAQTLAEKELFKTLKVSCKQV